MNDIHETQAAKPLAPDSEASAKTASLSPSQIKDGQELLRDCTTAHGPQAYWAGMAWRAWWQLHAFEILDLALRAAQGIEARSDETPKAAQPEGREPDGEAGAPVPKGGSGEGGVTG